MTVAIKDNFVTSSLPTSCASNILKGYLAPESATVVTLLERAGLVILGKTNMDEFGMGSHTRNSAFGPMRSEDRSVGGSSGGSAYLVAKRLAHFGIGTDTGGSVRLPAAYLNVLGFKPSYGMISRYGVVPYANSLDTVGLIAATCHDLMQLIHILSLPDGKDPTCLDYASRRTIRESNRHFSGGYQQGSHLKPRRSFKARRIGVPQDYNIAEMQNGVREAWIRSLNLLAAKGHEIVPISLPSTRHALSAYYVLAPAEASSNLAKYDGIRYGPPREDPELDRDGPLYSGHRGAHFGDEVKRRILLGTYSLSASAIDNFFIQAQKVRRIVQDDFNQVFRLPHPLIDGGQSNAEGVDFIVCPTAPTFPPTIESLAQVLPLESYINDVFTVPASLAGLPAISVPAPEAPGSLGRIPGRNAGIQVIGQYGNDYELLKFAQRDFEFSQDWSKLRHEERNRMP
jgi:aspartyl-tRNA(Asn)/glutamyl-tRNA(Gln) amidotransferase subunit A